jgi:hypothetical protein
MVAKGVIKLCNAVLLAEAVYSLLLLATVEAERKVPVDRLFGAAPTEA